MNAGEVITSITAAIGLAKELVSVDRAIDQAQLKLKVADLTSALADAKLGVTELRDELDTKDREISRLKTAFAFKGETIKRHDALYEVQDGNPVGMPFCQRCMAIDGLMIKLVETIEPGRPAKCPQCNANFGHQTRFIAM